MTRLSFFVAGTAKPQGSKKAFVRGGRATLVESAGQPLKDWRADVRNAAVIAMHDAQQTGPMTGPVAALITFVMARPKARKRDVYPATRPDADKLARGCLDALQSAGVYVDDGQIAHLTASKVYASPGNPVPGAYIHIHTITGDPQ